MNALLKQIVHYTWDIAYFDYKNDLFKWNCLELNILHNPYKNKWFADPFILSDSEEELQLFVEEFDSFLNRGRIARLVINKRKKLITKCTIILDLPTHLSFPVIYFRDGLIYVNPENSESGCSCIYCYDSTLDKLVDPICIVDEPVTDAIICEENYMFYLYATCLPNPNGDVLRVYESNKFTGPYKFVREEIFNEGTARMAGNFTKVNGKLLRPAQDCNGGYGKAVVFYDRYVKLNKLEPKGLKYCGIHTYNTLGNTGIIDLKKWDYPLLVFLKNFVRNLL